MSIGNFPESSSQAILAEVILVGRLGVPCVFLLARAVVIYGDDGDDDDDDYTYIYIYAHRIFIVGRLGV